MKIGIDLRALKPGYKGGLRSFSLGLVSGFQSNVDIVIIGEKKAECQIRNDYADCSYLFVRRSCLKFLLHRLLVIFAYVFKSLSVYNILVNFLYSRENKEINDLGLDLVICTTTYLNSSGLDAKLITCLHDVQEEYFPENFSFSQRVWRYVMSRYTLKYSDITQVSSKYIQKCLRESLGDYGCIVVLEEGIDSRFLNINSNYNDILTFVPSSPFLFYPAGLWPHKNHELLFKALSKYRDIYGREVSCILVGYDPDNKFNNINALVKNESLDKCAYLGQVDDEELMCLYSNCEVVLALGSHESSCLPIKEAFACGKKVIAMNIPPNVEFSDEEGFFLTDNDVDDLVSSIVDSLSSCQPNHEKLVNEYKWEGISNKYTKVV
ncbi:MAG: glycosyltransferase [Neptuniibacter sp.]